MRDLYDFVVHTPVKQESSFYVLGSTALVPELVEGRFAIRNSQFKIPNSNLSFHILERAKKGVNDHALLQLNNHPKPQMKVRK